MSQATQKDRFISIETPLGEDVLLLHDFTGTETLGRPFTFNLELLSEKKHNIDLNEIVGQNVTVRILLQEGGSAILTAMSVPSRRRPWGAPPVTKSTRPIGRRWRRGSGCLPARPIAVFFRK